MTLRRLLVLIQALPIEAPLWAALREAEEGAKRPTRAVLRDRQAAFERRNAEQSMTPLMRQEHDMGIAGHEMDCPLCRLEEATNG